MEMGADVVKLNIPKIDPEKDKDAPAPYNEMERQPGGGDPAMRRVGGPLAGRPLGRLEGSTTTTVLEQTRAIMEAGGSGVIFGRNVWQREWYDGAGDHRADQGDPALQRPRIP